MQHQVAMLLLSLYQQYSMEKWFLCTRWVGEMTIVPITGVYLHPDPRGRGAWFKDPLNNSSPGGSFKGCSLNPE